MKYAKIVFIIFLSLIFLSCSGEPGKDGSNGTDGTNGANGIDGQDGKLGKDGIDGEGGSDGQDGESGLDGQDGDDGKDGENGTDSTPDTVVVYNLSGKFEKGRCWEGGEIRVWPLEDGTLTQKGTHFIGTTGKNGTYNIRAETTEQYVLIYSKLTCDDEINGGSDLQELSGYRKTSDPFSNVNILIKISKPVADWLIDDPLSLTYGKVEESLIEAEKLTYEFLGMPVLEKRFAGMSLQKDSTSDAALALVSSMILQDMDTAEQADYTSRISTGITENDLGLKSEILELYNTLPLLTIKENLESSYLAAGIEIDTPPIWRLLDYPAYYVDLLESNHISQGSFNLNDSAGCSFDMSTYNRFAIPHVFKSWIETSKYIATNLDGDLSIWTRGFNGYDRPGAKILDVEELRENLLDGSLIYNGMLGDHNLTEGTEVYFVVTRDTGWALTTGCDGGLLPFGRKLASQDGGENWIGHDNNTVWFRKSGLKIIGID